ncbi:MAG: hypothetical protein KGY60_10110 [Bacteroidales bacterium]|nr:hypothetical protein [Bacteroidales bacterium]
MKKKGTTYLFVCLANMNRSPAAAMVMEGLARNRSLPIEAVSAGVSPMARRPVSRDLVYRADLIFVMEDYMKQSILRDYDVPEGKIIVLDIPDIYEGDDPVLVAQLRERLKPYA